MNRKEVAKNFAAMLLAMKALQINTIKGFQWASGWKSPIYCDNRKILGDPKNRRQVAEWVAMLIAAKYSKEKYIIAGVATAGIALGAIAADMLEVPFVYVRPEPKDHGTGSQIEGMELKAGDKVVVFEDLVSTGKSSLKIVEAIRATGAEVLGMVALVTYGFQTAVEAFAAANVSLDTLTNYALMMEVVEERDMVDLTKKQVLQQWYQDPAKWKPEVM